MKNDLVDVGLIGDTVVVAAICHEVGSSGALLVCNGCRDIEALIAGILVIEDDKEPGPCAEHAYESYPSKEPSHERGLASPTPKIS